MDSKEWMQLQMSEQEDQRRAGTVKSNPKEDTERERSMLYKGEEKGRETRQCKEKDRERKA